MMRATHDSNVKYAAVLHVLQSWKDLPESDLSRMVRTFYLCTDDFRAMANQGLLTMAFIGDEYIISPTHVGRLWLEHYDEKEKKHAR